MNLYLILRLLHISASIVFVGGLFARQTVRSLTSRASDVATIQTLTQAAGRVERWMVIPGNLLTIVFGLLLAFAARSPILGFIQGASRNWLLASVAILLLLLPLVPLVFLPRGRVFEDALGRAASRGEITAELRGLMEDQGVRWAHRVEMIGVALIVAFMVLKPF
jgi:uncharacterized membrane protein